MALTVTTVTPHNGKSFTLSMLLNDVAHISEFNSRFDTFNGFLQAFVSVDHKLLCQLLWFAHEKCFIEVTVVSSVIDSHVNIDNITILG